MLSEKKDMKVFYRPVSDPEGIGYLDKKLVEFRNSREPKTTGNPYYVMGEPVGDMRDNMDQPSIDISQGISEMEETIAGVPVWISEPEKQTTEEKQNRPCVFYIHGGGFIGGCAAAFQNLCKCLSERAQALVFNIDYRLAPETVFPENIEDCLKVLHEILKDFRYLFDREQIYLGGDSAGGNMALACAQKEYARTKGQYLKGLILFYPVTDLTMSDQDWKWDLKDYSGTEQEMESHCAQSLKGFEPQTLKLYLQEKAKKEDPLVSPIRTPDYSVYPDMLIISAEYDYLRPQVEAFAAKAAAAGNQVKTIRYGGMNLAFVSLVGIVEQAEDALREAADFILSRSSSKAK